MDHNQTTIASTVALNIMICWIAMGSFISGFLWGTYAIQHGWLS
jgi:hypothetical protein